jgi:aspartyl/asparaginyl-tRNA synthetase
MIFTIDPECPVHAWLTAVGEEIAVVRSKAQSDIASSWKAVDSQLSTSTFIAGEKLTVADISLFTTWLLCLEHGLVKTSDLVSVQRWARTLVQQPAVQSNMSSHLRDVVLNYKPAVGKWDRHRMRVKELLQRGLELLGEKVTVKGWVRTSRSAEKGALLFVELTDGSIVKGVQLVFNMADSVGAKEVAEAGGVGACIAVEGTVSASPAKGQSVEIQVLHAKVLGAVYGGENGEIGGKNYPMAKKQHTLEFLREKAHLRPRSKVFSAAMRIRHAMAFATHKFFNDRGFVYVHTPLITAADCEGAGEQFVVTTLLPDHAKLNQIPAGKDQTVDFSKDFFGRRCCLTVSGQLNVETHACALSDVYTFGPTFRAENSHTARHLAEFWMIEPEICFADLFDNMGLAVSPLSRF